MATEQKEQKKGDTRVYVISGLLFSCIVVGGVFLGMYITLPETQSSSWYPIAGMVLISIPWAFWFFTFIYSCISTRLRSTDDNNNQQRPAKVNTTATSGVTTATTTSTESPGGHVRFGAITVMGEEETLDDTTGPIAENQSSVTTTGEGEGEREVELHVETMSSSSVSNNEHNSFSQGSHESEVPLAFSMSS